MTKKVGRPSKDLPISAVEALCLFNPTKAQVLAGLQVMGHDVSPSTLDRTIKEHTGLNFDEFRDKKAEGTRLKLIQTAVQMAMGKDRTMLIFCLKNLCGWSDNNQGSNVSGPFNISLTYDPNK